MLQSSQMNRQVEEVKEKSDIVQVIGESVTLTKAGTNFKGLCPFHNEKSPSFMVSPEIQRYKCFGCGVSGDVFNFLQEYEGMEFSEALKYLADKAGVKLTPFKGEKQSGKEVLFEINEITAKFYHYILTKHKEGSVGQEYLSNRNIKADTIASFNIGFSPNKPSFLVGFLKNRYKFSDKDIVDAGVAVKTERGLIDRFRGRIIFPIYDHRGEAIALAGRILPQYDTGKVGKYINSPETPIYNKSRSLYGLNVTRSAIKRAGKAIVVEGEVDAVSTWQSGVQNVVAIKGSALTEEQVLLLSRYAKTFVLALDTDFAGNSAAVRAITQAQLKGVEVQVASMAPYKDPDEFAQKDPEVFKKSLENTTGVWDFLINLSLERHDTNTGAGKAAISREVVPLLATIPDRIVQSHYMGVLAQKLGVPVEAVAQQVEKNLPNTVANMESNVTNNRLEPSSRRETLEERTLSLAFLLDPKKLIDNKLVEMLSTPVLRKIADFYIEKSPENFNKKIFYDELPAELQEKYTQLLLRDETDEEELEREYKDTRYELELLYVRGKLSELAKDISTFEAKNDEDKIREAEREFQLLTKKLAQLQDIGI